MKQTLFYIDDEEYNLVVFESLMPETFEIKTFSNPLLALNALSTEKPCVIVTDQRMPGITGIEFLRMASNLSPESVRLLATGYSDESVIEACLNEGLVSAYIKKPWDNTHLKNTVKKAFQEHQLAQERKELLEKLRCGNEKLIQVNEQLQETIKTEVESRRKIEELSIQLESWIQPPLVKFLSTSKIEFPIERDIIGICYDVMNSSQYHSIVINDEGKEKPVLEAIYEAFSKVLLQNGGLIESSPGDSVYGHFGLADNSEDWGLAAITTASKFRVELRNMSQKHGLNIECGIAIHSIGKCRINLNTIEVKRNGKDICYKQLKSASPGIDLLHRIEKELHQLPGSSVILTDVFLECLTIKPHRIVSLGNFYFKGQEKSCAISMIPSDLLTSEKIEEFKKYLAQNFSEPIQSLKLVA